MADFRAPRHRRFGAACRLLGLISLLFASAHVEAADKRWNNRFGGAFNAAANWSGGVPGSGDIAEFGVATFLTPGTYTVTFDVSPTNQAIHVEDDFVTFELNGHTYTTTNAIGNEIGNLAGASGQLTITGGIWNLPISGGISRVVDIGAAASASGTLIVSTGGRIDGDPDLVVGAGGAGTLTVQNGGDILAKTTSIGSTSIGTATITGSGSTLVNTSGFSVGQNGSLTISLGGLVQNTDGNVFDGAVTVSGFNSRWNNSQDLFLTGGAGSQLTITGGGRVDSDDGFIGFAGEGNATVGDEIPGMFVSQWIVSGLNGGTLAIGASKFSTPGSGTLNILANGRVQNTDGSIAVGASSVGQVTLESPSAQWLNTGNLTIGDGGDGTLNITAGGYVQNLDGVVGAVAGSTGAVSVTDSESQWRSTGTITVGLSGHGTLSLSDGAIVQVDGTMFIAQDLGSVGVVAVDGAGSDLNSSSAMQIGNSGQATLTVTNGGSLSSTSAEIGGLVGITSSVTIDGPGSTWNTFGNIDVGDSGDAALTISNGGVVESTSGVLADAADATTSATITGAGSRWEMNDGSGTLYVGEDGTGTLHILDGGAVSNVEGHIGFDLGSNGTALVSGAGSTWTNSGELTIGRDGDGTLDITAGGIVQNSNGYIGRSNGNGGDGSGAVTVAGAGSTWTNTNFVYVGFGGGGEGALSVEAGGTVTCTTGFVGNVAGSHGTAIVDGPGSTWTTSGTLAVGDGALTISNGGAVVTNGLFGTLAAESMWDAEVTVVGQGSSWSLAGALLTVGFGGTAAVNILDGGNIVSLNARMAADMGSTGTVLVSGAGSTWTIGGRLGVGGDASNLVSGGTATLNIQPSGTVNVTQNIVIFTNGLVRLEGGTLDTASVSFNGGGVFDFLSGTLHVGTFNGNLVNQAGTLAPGHSAGGTTITGSYAQQSGAKLEIEIGGTSPGSTYDVVTISSIAGLSGQLQLALLDGFIPNAGDTFTVLTAASGIFGVFDNVTTGQRLDTIDGSGSFLVHYGAGSAFSPNQIVLTDFVSVALPGDFNGDGTVDAADYVAWRKNSNAPQAYNTWRTHFGESIGGPAAGSNSSRDLASSVPEPAGMGLLLISALLHLLYWPHGRRSSTAGNGPARF